jgi:hypothetical protein
MMPQESSQEFEKRLLDHAEFTRDYELLMLRLIPHIGRVLCASLLLSRAHQPEVQELFKDQRELDALAEALIATAERRSETT